MSLKINNNTITASDLTGGNSELRYFNSSLHLLVPNKTGYKLLGSPQQTSLLKQWANDSFNHNLTYTPKITNVVNPGDTTELFSMVSKHCHIYSGFSTSEYIKTVNNFNTGTHDYSIILGIITGANSSTNANFISENTNYSFSLGIANSKLFYYLSSNGISWTTSNVAGSQTLSTNSRYYLKFDYDYTTQKFISSISTDKLNWIVDYTSGKVNPPTNFLQFGVSRTVASPFTNGGIILESINIKIGDTVWFDGATAIQGTDYTVVGSPTITEETIEEYECSTFAFSFNLDSSALSQGTKYLLEHPNLIKVKTENNNLYFNFPWKNGKWYYLPENILTAGINNISLTSNASNIKLIVNSHNFTLVDSRLPLITTGVLGYKEDLIF